MNNKKLNNLVISYQGSRSEEVFTEIFEKVTEIWKSNNVLYSLARKYGLDYSEVESLANYTLYNTVRKYENTGNYYNFLSVALSRNCMKLRRDLSNYLDNEVSLNASVDNDNEDKPENPLIKFLVNADAEEEIVKRLQKKIDQRQLIDDLLDKAPSKCRQALEAYVDTDYSYTATAKLLNISYPAAKRRVEKIASYFDANQNGNLYDYFTVATA